VKKYIYLKTCIRCKKEKAHYNFHKNKTSKDNKNSYCKQCNSELKKKWRKQNEANKIKDANTQKRWRKRNLEHTRNLAKKYYEENREYVLERQKKQEKENRERINESRRRRYKEEPNFKLAMIIRNNLRRVLKATNSEKEDKTFDILGYSPKSLKDKIEMQFTDEMSWENYGNWHIDHKIPIKRFLEKGEKRPHIINALSNLQPMWASENTSKGSNYS